MDYSGRRVLILGLGRFGGGAGAARFLACHGARVTITDLCAAADLAPSLDQLADVPIAAIHCGGHRAADVRAADLIVVNPAVPLSHPLLALAHDRGTATTTEITLVFAHCPAPIVGVTGSNGKSTTAALVHALLDRGPQRAWLGGNIGGSVLDQIDQIRPADWVVLELSSFQLEHTGRLGYAPHAAVITNLTPNHLDRHGTMADYRAAKRQILRHQAADGLAVLNADCPEVRDWGDGLAARVRCFGSADPGRPGVFLHGAQVVWRTETSERWFPWPAGFRLPGRHNQANALAALACGLELGAPLGPALAALAAFPGLPHRLEPIAEWCGRRWYNDSAATTPESVAAALAAIPGPIVLIAGGSDKRIDLAALARLIAGRVRVLALIGQTAGGLARAVAAAVASSGRAGPRVDGAESLEAAVRWSAEQSEPGDAILLAPACASHDMFRDYADRGDQFRNAVARWIAGAGKGPGIMGHEIGCDWSDCR